MVHKIGHKSYSKEILSSSHTTRRVNFKRLLMAIAATIFVTLVSLPSKMWFHPVPVLWFSQPVNETLIVKNLFDIFKIFEMINLCNFVDGLDGHLRIVHSVFDFRLHLFRLFSACYRNSIKCYERPDIIKNYLQRLVELRIAVGRYWLFLLLSFDAVVVLQRGSFH